MSDALLDFTWPVATYRWIDLPAIARKRGEPHPGGFFTSYGPTHVLVEADTTIVRQIKPMEREHATLFQSFASLNATPTDVLAFAREYGRLGPPITRKIHRLSQEVKDGEELFGMWGLYGWANSIREMRFAIDLWQAIQDGHPHKVPSGDPFGEMIIVPKGSPLPSILPPILPIDEVIPDAQRRLAAIVNKQLALADLLSGSGPIVGPQLTVVAGGDFRLSYAPRTLLGAMWMQFAFAIAFGKQYPPCKHCKRPIEISKGPTTGFRVDREFCSARCKTADYRARRAKAKTLHKSRKSLRTIAREVNTPVATVRGWLADQRRS